MSEKWTSMYQILMSIKFSIRNIVSYSKKKPVEFYKVGTVPLASTVGRKLIEPVKNISLCLCMTFPPGRHLLEVLFITTLKSNLCTTLNTANVTQINCIISHAQNTTALQFTIFSIRTLRLLITNKYSQLYPLQSPAKVS
jgi:hypothetical protein